MEVRFKTLKVFSTYLFISIFAVTHFSASAESTLHYIVQFDEARQAVDLQDQVNQQLKRPLEIQHRYSHIFSGFSARLSEAEANLVRQVPGILRVVVDEDLVLGNLDNPVNSNGSVTIPGKARPSKRFDTSSGDPVVDLIGANRVWDGSATNDGGHLGEGTIIGIIGPGLPEAHPVFDSSGSDGYVHINPLGDGLYLGDCFATPQHACNSKLIGRYNFTSDPEPVVGGLEWYGLSLISQSAGNRLTGDSLAPWGVDIVTGVAPHANVIIYRTCPSFTCPATAIIQAFEQAITDGVDVLINTVGGSSHSPWKGVFAQATLALRDNGVMLSQAAGNGGPAPGSLSAGVSAPWNSVFVSSTHAHRSAGNIIGKFNGGNPPLPPTLQGGSIGTGVSAPIVYAGNIPNPNSPGNSALCLAPYPDSMLAGKIVVCDRGQIALVTKFINARDSGAVGVVLANVAGGPDTVLHNFYGISGIHLNLDNSNILRSWLNTGSGHHATIAASEAIIDFDQADHIALSSGRGPILDLNFLMPSATVPSQNVVVASSPDHFQFTSGPAAAPAGGVLALLKSARPEWTDAERLSAIMTTGVVPLLEDDGVTPTGTFTHGGGRVDLPAAVSAGLVLHETTERFSAANPLTGGDPKALNLAGLINLNCIETCSWSRTLRATQNGTWSAVTAIDNNDIQVDIIPSTFSLQASETQTIVVTTDRNGVDEGSFDGAVIFHSDNINVSSTALQLHVGLLADDDLDGLSNDQDNCLNVANPLQHDSDGDNYGNVCDADLNNDGLTNFLDLSLFSNAFQSFDPNADFNSDATINFEDLDIFVSLFLSPPGPSGLVQRAVN